MHQSFKTLRKLWLFEDFTTWSHKVQDSKKFQRRPWFLAYPPPTREQKWSDSEVKGPTVPRSSLGAGEAGYEALQALNDWCIKKNPLLIVKNT